jgi:hypothetical protein
MATRAALTPFEPPTVTVFQIRVSLAAATVGVAAADAAGVRAAAGHLAVACPLACPA